MLEVLATTIIWHKFGQDDLKDETLTVKEMFIDMVHQIIDNQIQNLNSVTVLQLIERNIPLLTKFLQNHYDHFYKIRKTRKTSTNIPKFEIQKIFASYS